MPAPAGRSFKATPQDRMQHIARYVCDQQLHVLLEFEQRLDEARLKRAARLVLEVEPVLASRWVEARGPRWQRQEGAYSLSCFMLVECQDPLDEALAFIATRADPSVDPLFQVRLLRGEKDVVCVKVNHVVSDAYGARQVAYLLCKLYNEAGQEDFDPMTLKGKEDRSMRPIWRSFSLSDRIGLIRKAFSVMRRKPKEVGTIWALPFTSRDSKQATMLLRRFDKERSNKIIQYAMERGATVNDVFLTAFVMANHALVLPKEGVDVPFCVPIDLRQYAPDAGADVANLTSTIFIEIARKEGQTFESMLTLVKSRMDLAEMRKDAAVGMPIVHINYGMSSFSHAKKENEESIDLMVKRRSVGPFLTNLGNLDETKLGFDGNEPMMAVMTAPITYPPFLAVGLSGYNDVFTLCLGFCEYGVDRNIVEKLIVLIDGYLPK